MPNFTSNNKNHHNSNKIVLKHQNAYCLNYEKHSNKNSQKNFNYSLEYLMFLQSLSLLIVNQQKI
jgi:hypothetical protein